MKEKIICHIITGFLGSGKSTFINQLLTYKPADEKWVVLVNESGKINYASEQLLTDNIFVKQIAGGCLCCTAGIPFRVTLNQLIKEHQPQRIFIEPSGAGHLSKIKQLLQGQFYLPILTLAPILCLLSQKQLENKKYSENKNYLALIEESDKLIVYEDNTQILAKKMAVAKAKPFYLLQGGKDYLQLLSGH